MKIQNLFFVNTCTGHINAPCYSFTFLCATRAGTYGAEATGALASRALASRAMAIGAEATGAVATGAVATGARTTEAGARNP